MQCTWLRLSMAALITSFMWSIWGPSGADRIQVGPMLAPWTLLSGWITSACSRPNMCVFVVTRVFLSLDGAHTKIEIYINVQNIVCLSISISIPLMGWEYYYYCNRWNWLTIRPIMEYYLLSGNTPLSYSVNIITVFYWAIHLFLRTFRRHSVLKSFWFSWTW